MLAVTHTIMSVTIGMHVQQPAYAFALAFILHNFADTLLHWNIYVDKHRWPYAWVVLDVVGALAAAYWLAPDRFLTPAMLAAILGGNLPDIWGNGIIVLRALRARLARRPLMRLPSLLVRVHQQFLDFHDGLQYETVSATRGLVWQVVLSGVAIALTRTAAH